MNTITNIGSVKMTYNDFLANMLDYLVNNDTTHSTNPKNDKNKVILVQTYIKKEDCKIIHHFLGWLPQERVKKRFDCTTQLAMGSFATLPFR